MTADERSTFDATYQTTRLALDVGDQVRDAREAAGLSQGDVRATLTKLQKVAAALDMRITIELSAADRRDLICIRII